MTAIHSDKVNAPRAEGVSAEYLERGEGRVDIFVL